MRLALLVALLSCETQHVAPDASDPCGAWPLFPGFAVHFANGEATMSEYSANAIEDFRDTYFAFRSCMQQP